MTVLQGLIFDLDGTMLDSAPDVRQAMNMMLNKHGLRSLTLEETKAISGDGLLVQMQRALVVAGEDNVADFMSYFQEFVGFYRTIPPDHSQIYPGVVDTLQRYSKAGVKLGVCTNKQESATYRLLKHLGIDHYFEFVAGGDTFPVHKPNPDHIFGVITALDVPRESCAMVGDSHNDVIACRGAKIPCIAVTHGYALDARELGADAVIDGFDELPKALAGLGFDEG